MNYFLIVGFGIRLTTVNFVKHYLVNISKLSMSFVTSRCLYDTFGKPRLCGNKGLLLVNRGYFFSKCDYNLQWLLVVGRKTPAFHVGCMGSNFWSLFSSCLLRQDTYSWFFFSLGSWHLHIRVFLSAEETLVTSSH